MERLSRFAKNAGVWGVVQCVILAVAMGFVLRKEFQTGNWMFTLPIMAAGLGVGYAARNILVENFELSRKILNGSLVAMLVLVFVARRANAAESPFFNLVIAAFTGLYMGCYFWMLSDERVGRLD